MWLPRLRERARESTRNKSLTGMMGCGPKLSQTGHLSATRTSQLKACLAWLPALLAPPQHLVLHLEPQDQLPRLGVGGEGVGEAKKQQTIERRHRPRAVRRLRSRVSYKSCLGQTP